ncbi:MAG TPA: hypothetical protein VD794_12930 [Flavisolibacter sp.]|nr:hypothetical protein [Flavisolibacter sp.]
MTQDEAKRMAKRKNDAKDGWKYEAGKYPATQGGYAVFRKKGDVMATELYRSNNY